MPGLVVSYYLARRILTPTYIGVKSSKLTRTCTVARPPDGQLRTHIDCKPGLRSTDHNTARHPAACAHRSIDSLYITIQNLQLLCMIMPTFYNHRDWVQQIFPSNVVNRDSILIYPFKEWNAEPISTPWHHCAPRFQTENHHNPPGQCSLAISKGESILVKASKHEKTWTARPAWLAS